MTDANAIATQFRADVLRADAHMMQELTRRWQAVERALQAEIDALSLELAQNPSDVVTVGKLYQRDRYQSLLVQLRVELARYTADAATLIQAQQLSFAHLGGDQAAEWLRYAGAIRGTFDTLNTGAIENIVALARAGNPLATLLDVAYPTAAQGITDMLIRGVALGWNPRKTAQKVCDDGLAQGLNHVLLVSRDQSLRAWRLANLQQYQSSGLVKAYTRICAKQRRTCLACLALDGAIYQTNEMMPTHPQCRCTILPILHGREPLQSETGAAWFGKQSATTQREMLGAERYQLWKSGAFRFQDLAQIVDAGPWGQGTKVRGAADLQRMRQR